MRTIDSHSAFNREQNRNGVRRRNPNVEVVPTYIIHSRVCRKVRVMWRDNEQMFYTKFTSGSFSKAGVYNVDRLQDALELKDADNDVLNTLEANLNNTGYIALENYLKQQLKIVTPC